MLRAVIVGGTGQIGLAAARRLIGEAWDVTVVSRHATTLPDGSRHFEADARDAEGLCVVVGSDTDLLLSCVWPSTRPMRNVLLMRDAGWDALWRSRARAFIAIMRDER